MGLFNFIRKSEPERRTPPVDRAYLPAWNAASLLTRFLESRRVAGWAETFGAVERALASGDAADAIRLFDGVPMAHMGGFLDLVICRENGHRTSEPGLDNGLLLVLHDNLKRELDVLRG
jgi:hypothetical protein